MKENFLHFVWQYQYFSKAELKTSQGESIHIIHPGSHNTNAGPDFINSKIKIGDMEWAGNVEIHYNASDWFAHAHEQNTAYDNVALHVVWKNNKEAVRKDGTIIPTIELKGRVDEKLIFNYSALVKTKQAIPCAASFKTVADIKKVSMLDKALMQRLERKAADVKELLVKNNNDWEETAYQCLAKSFGFKVNNEAFLSLSKSLPYKIIKKHSNSIIQLEALLFGTAGLLDAPHKDEYPASLKNEFDFLQKKYSLDSKKLNESEWKFLRVRPANFPTTRIAEFAAVVNKVPHLFSLFIEEKDDAIMQALSSAVSSYWKNHYIFDKEVKRKPERMGKISVNNIIINTIAPLLVCYGREIGEDYYIEKAVRLIDSIPVEDNAIIRQWKEIGLLVKNASDSQGALELYNNFCKTKSCLLCTIGADIVSRS